MAGSELQTNFNVAPYFDDYNEDKQFYRILFKPSVAVQARELTQLQTIFQRQISRFGNKVFKDGSKIEGLSYTSYANLPQIKFRDSNTATFDFSYLTDNNGGSVANSYLLVSNTSGVRAVVFAAYTGAESVITQGGLDTNRVYLNYISSGNVGVQEVTTFIDNEEQIDVYHYTNQSKQGPLSPSNLLGSLYTLASNSSINAYGVGYGMRVGEGIIYQKGFFLKTLPQTFMVVEHSSNAAGRRVGFDTRESIVTEYGDQTLNDNSIGSYNYTAPGAHRLKLTPFPVVYDASNTQVTIPENFFPILEFDGGDGRIVVNRSDEYQQLSTLGDTMAKRTYEESGDYIVKPFSIDVVAHESNTSLFYYNVGAGLAYVDGYRVELASPRKTSVLRATNTESRSSQLVSVNMGNYVKVQNFAGTIPVEDMPDVMLIKGDQELLGNNLFITNPIGGTATNWVGNAKIRAITFETGSAIKGTPNAQFRFYITDIRMKPGKNFLNDADSIYLNDVYYGKSYADLIKDRDGKVIYYDTQLQNLLFDTGKTGIKRLTDSSNNNDTSYIYRKTIPTNGGLSPSAVGEVQMTFTLSGTDQYNYGVGYLSDVNSSDINITFSQDTYSNTILSDVVKAGYNSTGANITSPTDFTENWYVGMGLKLANTTTSGYVTVRAINNSNSVYVTPVGQIPAGTLEMAQFWKQGTHVNFTGSGNTIYVDDNQNITATLKLDLPDLSPNFYAQVPLMRINATPIEKVVNKNSIVKIDCSTHWNRDRGPWNLGLTDVYSISNVHVGSTAGTPYSEDNPDRKDWFYIDSGQRDDSYKLASILLRPQYVGALTSTSTFLVKVNHFTANITASKAGFFSVDSYPVDDSNPTSSSKIATAQIPQYVDTHSLKYDLRNYIDFRLVMANTANVTAVIAEATTNPANNDSTYYTGGAQGISIEPDSNFTYNVEYYLPRKDILVIDKNGALDVKYGTPSLDPQLPGINNSGLQLADIYVPPYPSLTFTESE